MSRHFNSIVKYLVLGLLLQQLTCCDAVLEKELQSCATAGIPVCARAGNEVRLFPNECVLTEVNRVRNIGMSYFERTMLRYCLPKCDFACAKTMQPVCAVNQINGDERNFDNRCEMAKQSCLDNMDWILVANNKCFPAKILNIITPKPIKKRPISTKRRRRPVKCHDVLNPVCATFSGVKSTFKNECLVNAENIRTGKTWEIFSHGICEEDYANLSRDVEAKDKKSIHAYGSLNNYMRGGSQPHMLHQHFAPQLQPPQQQLHMAYDDGLSYIMPPSVFQTEIVSYSEGRNPKVAYREELNYGFKNLTQKQQIEPEKQSEKGVAEKDSENCQFGNTPICGIDGTDTKTFKNLCNMILTNINSKRTWSILHEGACPSCDFNCPRTYEPVCVQQDGLNITLRNKCELRAKMCENRGSTWQLLQNEACFNDKMTLTTTTAVTTATTTKDSTSPTDTTTKLYFFIKNQNVTKKPLSGLKNKKIITATAKSITTNNSTKVTRARKLSRRRNNCRRNRILRHKQAKIQRFSKSSARKSVQTAFIASTTTARTPEPRDHIMNLYKPAAKVTPKSSASQRTTEVSKPSSTTEANKRLSVYGSDKNSSIMYLASHKVKLNAS